MTSSPMFGKTEKDGLTFVIPLAAGHRVYKWRAFFDKLGQAIDRILLT